MLLGEAALPPYQVASARGGRAPAQYEFGTTKASSSRQHPASVRLRFVGDIVLGRYRAEGFRRFAAASPDLGGVRQWLDGDLVLANLETPVVSELPAQGHFGQGSYFGADPS